MEQTRCKSFTQLASRLNASDSRPSSAFLLPHSGESQCKTAPSCQTATGSSRCPLPRRVDARRNPHKKTFPVRMRKQPLDTAQTQSGPAIQPSHSPRFPLRGLRSRASHPEGRMKNRSGKKLKACSPAALNNIAICRRQPPFYGHLLPFCCHLPPSAAAF